MSDEFLGKRRQALEDSFFDKRNRELLEKLQREVKIEENRAALSSASGITSAAVLDHLASLNIGPEAVAALSLVPLIQVAWTDGRIHENEREAVLRAAEQQGLNRIPSVPELIENWLTEKPDDQLVADWRAYVAALCGHMDGRAREALKHDVMNRARQVAEAAGGFLGIGSISAVERATLKELEAAFDV